MLYKQQKQFRLNILSGRLTGIMILYLFFTAYACQSPSPPSSALTDHPGHLSEPSGEWHNDKFSMFIHWGIYSGPGGVWNGKPVTRGYSEQIQAHAGIYSDVYARLAEQFNPQKWDPDSIVLLAKEAGMRSVVITSKHHDGFCMFESEHTDYNVVQATPCNRDVIGELAAACERHGLKFGLYFSLIDWHYPPAYPISSHNADFIPDRHHEYNMNQVRELLTDYGPVSELWFDMGSLEPAQSRELKELVHSLQPDCMVSGRLGNDMGDFTVLGDNEIPDYTLDTPWQTPASMFAETWGYRSWQERGDPDAKIREKLEDLIRVVSRGGNYLLNIGPRGDGSVVEFERDVLLGIGDWLRINGEAIYGTRPAGFSESPPWGEITAKNDRIYLHLLNPTGNGVIKLTGITGKLLKCYLLDNPDIAPEYSSSGNQIAIRLPDNEEFTGIRVLVLQFEDNYTVIPENITDPSPFGETKVLDRHNSHKHYSFSGVDYYSNFRSIVRESWTFAHEVSGNYRSYLYFSEAEKSRAIELVTPGGIRHVRLQNGEEFAVREDLSGLEFGPVYINGPHTLRIDRKTGMEHKIDITAAWPSPRGPFWEKSGAGPGEIIERGVRRNHCWYLWQEIESEDAGELLVQLIRSDGVQVFLNGKEIYLHNNPLKKKQKKDILLLPLKAGSNELLVKFYNRFGRNMAFSADYDIPQTVYRKLLEDISLPGTPGQQISWHLHESLSLHSNMAMPNLRLVLHNMPEQ